MSHVYDTLRELGRGEISAGQAMELIAPHVLEWNRGFPPKSGMYLVQLEDGEHCVTPFTVVGDEGVDTWGDKRRSGWTCLTGSRATVKAWARIPKAIEPALQRAV